MKKSMFIPEMFLRAARSRKTDPILRENENYDACEIRKEKTLAGTLIYGNQHPVSREIENSFSFVGKKLGFRKSKNELINFVIPVSSSSKKN